ncbi:MAG: hypothetical protein OXG79_09245 [Chloroflexi bacterium]|nr:hypothetical protein [Chloroflexota bacterium]
MTPEAVYIAAAIGTLVVSVGAIIRWINLPRIPAQVRGGCRRLWRLLKGALNYARHPWTFPRTQKAFNDDVSTRLSNAEIDVRRIQSHILAMSHILEELTCDDKKNARLSSKQNQMLAALIRIRMAIHERLDVGE